jgi:peptide/nickel transport system substrate-binding protein
MGFFRTLMLAAGLLLLCAAPSQAQRSLTIGAQSAPSGMDPHYHSSNPNNAILRQIFETLVDFDTSGRLVPRLAESWRAIDDLTWEFKLRPNVRFHNGAPFTAEDVAATMRRLPNVPNAPSSFAAYSRPITRIEIVDPLTIRFHTAQPYPLMPLDMTNVRIISATTHANATTEGFNSGALAIGTGPFRVVQHRSGDRIEFERYAEYFEGASPFQRVSYRMITNDAARTAGLLAGDIDFIDQVPTTDLARLRNDQRLHLSETVGLRLVFLALDHLRGAEENSPHITDNDGRPLGRNPLKDVRVRRALSMAIDRAAITSRIMDGAATPANQFLPPGTFSHVADLPAIRHDPEGARRLLAQANPAIPVAMQAAKAN